MTSSRWRIGAFVALVSLVGIFLEIALTRIFSVIYLYHLISMVLAITFIGASSGGLIVYAMRDRLRGPGGQTFAFAMSLCLILACCVQYPLLAHTDLPGALERGAILPLLGSFSVLTLPFLFVSIILCTFFIRYPKWIGFIYCLDLLGAGTGAILYMALIRYLGGAGSIFFCGAVAGAAALLVSPKGIAPRLVNVALLLLVAGAVVSAATSDKLEFRPRNSRAELGGEEQERRWSSVSSLGVYPHATAGPKDKFLLIDSICGTPLFHFAPGGRSKSVARGDSLWEAPFTLLDEKRSIAILGAGAGADMLRAQAGGFQQVTGVEVNPLIVELVRQGTYSPGMAAFINQPGVQYVRDEARAFLAASGRKFQVIQIPFIESRAALLKGALTFAENLLFTREAFKIYMDHLAEDGLIFIHRYITSLTEPTHLLKLVSLVETAAPELAGKDLSQHLLIASNPATRVGQISDALFIFSRRPIPPRRRNAFAAFTRAHNFTIHAGGGTAGPTLLARFINSPAAREKIRQEVTSDTYAPDDDSPYFFRRGRPFAHDLTNQTLTRILGVVLLLLAGMVSLPLLLIRREGGASRGTPRRLIYFGCIGLGFMITEAVLIQRFFLVFGRPEVAMAITLVVLLVSSGAGSLLSGRLVGRKVGTLPQCAMLVSLLLLVLTFTFPTLIQLLEGSSFAIRVAAAVILLAPLGLLMGMFFPRGILSLEQNAPGLIPWAWVVNGLASVLGSLGSLYLAINTGAQVALAVGVLAYLLIALVHLEEGPAEPPVTT